MDRKAPQLEKDFHGNGDGDKAMVGQIDPLGFPVYLVASMHLDSFSSNTE